MRTVLNQMENEFSDFYFSSYDCLYLQFYGDTADFPSVSLTKNRDSNLQEFTGKVRNMLKRMKNQFSDFNFLSYGRFCNQNSSKIGRF